MLGKLLQLCLADISLSSQLQNVNLSPPTSPPEHVSSPPLTSPQSPPVPPPSHSPVSTTGQLSPPPPQSQAPSTFAPSSNTVPALPPAREPAPFLPHPNSSQWTSADLLPPPPPPAIRSGGVRQAPAPPAPDTPRRVTRSQKGPIGDPDVNPYKKGSRKGGEGVI